MIGGADPRADVLPRQRLSEFFSWDETWHSETAERVGLDNTPPAEVRQNIEFTATQMDRVRRLLGRPVLVSSWYRSSPVNMLVGGTCDKATLERLASHPNPAVATRAVQRLAAGNWQRAEGAHVEGFAVDFRCPSYGPPRLVFEALRSLLVDLRADQLILEYANSPSGGWVHISFDPAVRLQALVIDDKGTRFV